LDGGRIPESALYVPTEIIFKWKLLKNGVPTNGAVLLFSNNIDGSTVHFEMRGLWERNKIYSGQPASEEIFSNF
jgi:hypothetical protein